MSSRITIVFLDKDDFSLKDIHNKPLAGAQSAFVELVKAFADLGYSVKVRNYCNEEYADDNIDWKVLTDAVPDGDIYIVNRSTSLLALVPKGKRTFFWMHNEGKYLLRLSNIRQLLKHYPILVFSGKYHRSSLIIWFLFRTRIIPYGISSDFINNHEVKDAPAPKVIFTSNPLRSLDWLIDRWKVINRNLPGAELHIFSGPATYGTWGASVAERMNEVLEYAKSNRKSAIELRQPIPKKELINEIKTSRAMLYRGDRAETFCLAIGEAQALGLPCVVQDLGSMKERVIDGVTGFVTNDDKEFEEKSTSLLTDDSLWLKMHRALITNKYYSTWKESAQMFLD